jgi:hypothetical protein
MNDPDLILCLLIYPLGGQQLKDNDNNGDNDGDNDDDDDTHSTYNINII